VDKYVFNKDTNRRILENLMTNGIKVANGSRLGKTIVFARIPPRRQNAMAVVFPCDSFVKGWAKCTSQGRVKVCHLRQGICHRVGSWIPMVGITKELVRGEPTQDGNRNFNTDTA
jgi:hypothetical protein